MQDYKKLKVWQKSYTLAMKSYNITRRFPKEELYGLVNQMRRAAVSVPANIAEGCGRYTDAELVRFLDIALGSLSELDCYFLMSRDQSFISPEDFVELDQDLTEVRRMLIALIQKVRATR